MNTILTFFLLCPIPEDQKPMKEYLILQENSIQKLFLGLYKQNSIPAIRLFFFSFLFFFSLLIIFFSFSTNFFFVSFFFTLNFFFFLFFVLYIRWKTLFYRFYEARFFYEESSWYDGQIWEKPSFILKTDRLIGIQKIKPLLQGLKVFFGFFFVIDILSFLFFAF